MAKNTKTLGANQKVMVYVEGKRLARDFSNITSFEYTPEYFEGEDSYLGRGPVEPWQLFKLVTGSFKLEEETGFIRATLDEIRKAEQGGQRPDIKVVLYTANNDGTTSKTTFKNGTLRGKFSVAGKGDKAIYDMSFRLGELDEAA